MAPGSLRIRVSSLWVVTCSEEGNIRTPSTENIANFLEGLLSAQWVLGKWSRSLWRCKRKVGLVHHMLHWSPRLLVQPQNQYREKIKDLRDISATTHIAFAVRSSNGALYEIVSTDCEG